MRIRKLHLRPFGSFEDRELTFVDGGMHIVVGANEAGKSTALDAIRYGLFGIPRSSKPELQVRDHRFDKKKLRIGLMLESSRGQTFELLRASGTKGVVRSVDDKPSDELADELSSLLLGVDMTSFIQQHGIDHQGLQTGAQSIVSLDGRVNVGLQAAAAGMHELHQVLQKLQEQRREFLTDAGGSGMIHDQVKLYKAAKKQLAQAQNENRPHRELHDRREQLKVSRIELATALQNVTGKQNPLTRVIAAQPLIVEWLQQSRALSKLPSLPDGWLATWQGQAQSVLVELEAEENKLNAVQTTLRERTEARSRLQVRDELLAAGSTIEDLRERRAVVDDKRRELRESEREHELLVERVATAAASAAITADGIDQRSQLPAALVADAQATADEHASITAKVVIANDELRDARETMQSLALKGDSGSDGSTNDDLRELRAALEAAQKFDQSHLRRLTEENVKAQIALDHQASQILGREAAFDQLQAIKLPSTQDERALSAAMNDVQKTIDSVERDLANAQSKIASHEAEIESLIAGKNVPTKHELDQLRSSRDAKLDAMLKQVQPQTVSAFASALHDTDELADQLIVDAHRSERVAQFREAIAADEQRIKQWQRGLADHQSQLREVSDQWRELMQSAGLPIHAPADHRELITTIQAWQAAASRLSEQRGIVELLQGELATIATSLATALNLPVPETIDISATEQLKSLATTRCNEATEATAKVEQRAVESQRAQHELQRREQACESLQTRLSELNDKWVELRASMKISDQIDLAQAATHLQAIQEHDAAVSALSADRARRDGMKQAIEGYERDLHLLQKSVQSNESLDEICIAYTQSQSASAKREEIDARISDELSPQVAALTSTLAQIQDQLHRCQTAAGVSEVDELRSLVALGEQHRELLAAIRETESSVLQGTGRKAVDIVEQFPGADISEMEQSLAAMSDEISTLQTQVDAIDEELTQVNQRIGAIEASADGTDAAQQMANAQEAIDSLVPQYRRLWNQEQLLSGILQRQRAEQTGPLIEKASQLFAQLTLHGFTGLQVNYDDAGEPTLVAVRAQSDEQVLVGGLSEGSLDQLYLALRLAALHIQLDTSNREPMPFIVDDLLLTFDDDRAAAALEALAQLATKTQVIFLTHHRHLAEIAHDVLSSDQYSIQELDLTGAREAAPA